MGGDALVRSARDYGFTFKTTLRAALPIALILILKEPFREFGLGLGNIKAGLPFLLGANNISCPVHFSCRSLIVETSGVARLGVVARGRATSSTPTTVWRRRCGHPIAVRERATNSNIQATQHGPTWLCR